MSKLKEELSSVKINVEDLQEKFLFTALDEVTLNENKSKVQKSFTVKG